MSMIITTYLYFFDDLFSEWAHFCWATDSHLLATFISEKYKVGKMSQHPYLAQ